MPLVANFNVVVFLYMTGTQAAGSLNMHACRVFYGHEIRDCAQNGKDAHWRQMRGAPTVIMILGCIPAGILIGLIGGQYLTPDNSAPALRNPRELFYNPSEDPTAGAHLLALPDAIRKKGSKFVFAFTMGSCSSCSQRAFDPSEVATLRKMPKIAIVERAEAGTFVGHPWAGFDLTVWVDPKEYRRWNPSWSGRAYVLSMKGELIRAQGPDETLRALEAFR